MTPAQRRFVDEYLIDLDAQNAAIRSGYSKKNAAQQGYKLRHKPEIAAEIEKRVAERSERTQFDADWVLKRLADEALADLADLYDDSGSLKPIAQWPLIWRQGLVSGLDVDETIVDGKKRGQVTKVKQSERIKRIELIGKHVDVGAFAEKNVLTGPDGGPVKVEDVTITEAARRIAFLLAQASQK